MSETAGNERAERAIAKTGTVDGDRREGQAEEPAADLSGMLVSLALEIGPLAVFFLAYRWADLYVATGLFIVAALVSLVVSYLRKRRLPTMPLVSFVVVVVFGGLTLWLHDEQFIKLKPTIINGLLGATLLIGLCFGKSLLRYAFDDAFPLDDEGWKKLTLRCGLFFLALAGLNELVWRTQTTDTWVNFKVFAFMPLTLLFMMAQIPLMQRHEREAGSENAPHP